MDTLKRRLNLLESDVVPTKSELRTQMKNEFSEIILQTMSPYAQTIMGYNEFLKGPSNLLWISPQDHLNLDVKITEQENEYCSHILTSDGIEQLGAEIDGKIEDEIKNKIQRALVSQEIFYKTHCNDVIENAIVAEVKIHERNREDIRQKYVKLFKDEFVSLRSKFKKEHEQILSDLEKKFLKQKCEILRVGQ